MHPPTLQTIHRGDEYGNAHATTENPMRQSISGDSVAGSLYGTLQHELNQRVESKPHCCSKMTIDTVAQFYDSILIVKTSHQETVCCCCQMPDGYSMQAVPKYKLRTVAVGKEGMVWAIPCCFICTVMCPPSPNYVINIGMFDDEKEKSAKSLWDFVALPQVISLVCKNEPDSQFLFSYVYGPLCGNMKSMHRLSHMINDDLANKLSPNHMSDL